MEEPDDTTDPETGKSLTGAWVWDCALVVSHWLAYEPAWPAGSFSGLNVLELGAGIGLPGLVLASLGANVVLADRKALLPAIRRNIARNSLEVNAVAVEVEWGDGKVGANSFTRKRPTVASQATNSTVDVADGQTDRRDDTNTSTTKIDDQSPGQRKLEEALREIEVQSRLILESERLSASHGTTATSANEESGSTDAHTGKIDGGGSAAASEKQSAATSSASGGRPDRERGGTGGEEEAFTHPVYDIILGSDITYDVSSMEDLSKTIKRFMGPKTRVSASGELTSWILNPLLCSFTVPHPRQCVSSSIPSNPLRLLSLAQVFRAV